MLSEFDGLTTESHLRAWRQFGSAFRKPFPIASGGAARLAVAVSLGELDDGTVGLIDEIRARLSRTPHAPELPSCIAISQVDFVGSASWLEPGCTILLGVVTILGASGRKHLLGGAEALRCALRPELQRLSQHELAGFPAFQESRLELPTAEQLIGAAHA